MSLNKVVIDNVRNIKHLSVTLSPEINLIYGNNASGKSSFLEAIFILGRAKSFRTPRISQVINYQSDDLTVFGELSYERKPNSSIGVRKKNKETEVRISGQKISSLSELATLLPIQFIHPGSQQLFEAGPSVRRQFIDWGVFHVEHLFLENWRNYRRALSQRNSLLRQGDLSSINSWNREVAHFGQIITDFRKTYIQQLESAFIVIAQNFFCFSDYKLTYKPGWDLSSTLHTTLEKGLESDRRCGFTQHGPHRADFSIYLDGHLAQNHLSRGQLKLLVLALNFAQAGIMANAVENPGCVLIDDLSSELDGEVKEFVFDYLKTIKSQIFITATEKAAFSSLNRLGYKTFHVEQGCIKSA
jgi:DNA replication and repair protein RecF